MAADQGKRSPRFDSPAAAPIYSPRSMARPPNPGDPENLWGGMSTGIQITAYLLAGMLAYGGGWDVGWSAALGVAIVGLNFVASGLSLAWAAGISLTAIAAVVMGGFVVRM